MEADRGEAVALYHDLLINLTSFFRDTDLFEAIKTEVFPRVVKGRFPTATFRVWVPGCSTGQEAYSLAIAAEFVPGVALLDIGLPKMNGHEVARRIRERPHLRDVVLIAQTGWGQDEDRRNSREAGFDRHLVKPVDPDALGTLFDPAPDARGPRP